MKSANRRPMDRPLCRSRTSFLKGPSRFRFFLEVRFRSQRPRSMPLRSQHRILERLGPKSSFQSTKKFRTPRPPRKKEPFQKAELVYVQTDHLVYRHSLSAPNSKADTSISPIELERRKPQTPQQASGAQHWEYWSQSMQVTSKVLKSITPTNSFLFSRALPFC
ncbi:hypothetical protein D3C87_1287040 [compost metagenome]